MKKVIRVVIALVLTVLMLYIARTNSRGQPEDYSVSHAGYTLEMTSVPKITEGQTDLVDCRILGSLDGGQRVMFRTSQPSGVDQADLSQYAGVSMLPDPDQPGRFYTEVTAGERGGRFYYYFEIVDTSGSSLARFTDENDKPWLLKYIGEVPSVIMVGHVLFIFATVFCVAMVATHALGLLRHGRDVRPMAVYLFWAAAFCFVGGYPFGFAMNHYAFNVIWEGVPFGTDATDNKTQLLLVYLVFAALASVGSLTRGKLGRDIYSPGTLGGIGLGSFAVMLFIYLIPHSIQFSPGFTYAFCYISTAVVAAFYITGYLRSRSKSSPAM
ncbi:MAG: hypothetical protein JSU65_11980 [Candidatus Zixiibacteriota bacterium]|nr:MAG: hypothetical protein JSU65_11980 [candidate division Zixibacteria bacterium]